MSSLKERQRSADDGFKKTSFGNNADVTTLDERLDNLRLTLDRQRSMTRGGRSPAQTTDHPMSDLVHTRSSPRQSPLRSSLKKK